MKGDYVDVTVRATTSTGNATFPTKFRIQASRDGASVTIEEPRERDLFFVVKELGKTGKPIRSASFAKGEVLAVVTGNEPLARPKRAPKAVPNG